MKKRLWILLFCLTPVLAIFLNTGCSETPAAPAPTPTYTPTLTCSGASGQFGLTTTDGVNSTQSSTNMATQFTMASNGAVTAIAAGICGSSGPTTAYFGIYSDASGGPGTLMGPAASQVISSCPGGPFSPVTVTLSTPLVLYAGTYWVAVGSPGELFYSVTASTGTNVQPTNPGAGALPSTYPSANFSYCCQPQLYGFWACP
ncbi:MAG TPA: hypothetical protein VHE12_05320 [bacterium]|nr:hypothetical protein [bacterium]